MNLKNLKLLKNIPDFSDYFGNKLYDTSKSTLLAYTINDGAYDMDGRIGGAGIFFKGLYKTKNGNYFLYSYENETKNNYLQALFIGRSKLYDNRKKIRRTYTEFPLEIFKSLDVKLTTIEDEIEIVEA